MEREELEKWLKQSFYPYFYVNSTSFGEFDAFDVENYADVMGEDKVEAIRENISDYWGIHDRKSLMKTTDSLLQKGDKYTYAQTLEKLGEEAMKCANIWELITHTITLGMQEWMHGTIADASGYLHLAIYVVIFRMTNI